MKGDNGKCIAVQLKQTGPEEHVAVTTLEIDNIGTSQLT